jgi:hypothetical protein
MIVARIERPEAADIRDTEAAWAAGMSQAAIRAFFLPRTTKPFWDLPLPGLSA